ncbi:hypothetical protein NSPZN2_80103 [Nitrospira defluvii]|uniref:Transposase DDE domain-containing protein n=1 Tax=Nitrospira defluvii TaxID=330214 RepID=A0ABN7MKF2_9BACT|nr:hypothetical protein NSPZN2_80103 [Nitrospira defluvii]
MRKQSASGVLARHCRLTFSAAFTNVTLLLRRVADLAAALLDGLFAHPAWCIDAGRSVEPNSHDDEKSEFFRNLLRPRWR